MRINRIGGEERICVVAKCGIEGQEAHPRVEHHKQEYGCNEGEETPGIVRPGYALYKVVQRFHPGFHEILEAARHHLHATSRKVEDGYEEQ